MSEVSFLTALLAGVLALLNLHDFDAAALKDGRPRALTQSVATYLHATTELDGVTFASRHGDDLALWAVFERARIPRSAPPSTRSSTTHSPPEHADVQKALRILELSWAAA
ncbi:hypothetical protein [Nocardioides aurantiacus]|uniref:hypothetical protein n=1 Tax=Nocardioides aurantiacus TaxID=86796 RepID=UPI00403F5E19